MDNYVEIMLDSLKKKAIILDRLISKNEEQAEIIENKQFDDVNWDKFNIIIAEKEAEIDRINEMDEGFQTLYDRIGGQLKDNKDKYAKQIKEMQQLIKLLEEKSVKIRTGEEKNRNTIEKIMMGRKSEIKQTRTSLKAASSYYKTMQSNFYDGTSSMNTAK